MKLNANHGIYRKHREMNKILIRKINAYCEVTLTPKRKVKHISNRDRAKQRRILSMCMAVAYTNMFFNEAKEGGKQ